MKKIKKNDVDFFEAWMPRKQKRRKMSKSELTSLWKIHGGNYVVYQEPACVVFNHNGRKK